MSEYDDLISALEADLEFAAEEVGADMQGKKRGAKPKSEKASAPEPQTQEGPDLKKVEDGLRRGFTSLGKVLHRGLGVSDFDRAEVDMLAEGWAPLVHEYAGVAGRYAPFVVAGVATFTVAAPRWAEYQDIRAKQIASSAGVDPSEPSEEF